MNTYTTFNSIYAITQRARKLSTLDHGELALLLARLEWAVRRHADALNKAENAAEDQLAKAEQQATAAGQQVTAVLAAVNALVQQ